MEHIAHCPGCGSMHAIWVTSEEQRNLLCLACGSCWHDGRRVNPRECPGCPSQPVCLAGLP